MHGRALIWLRRTKKERRGKRSFGLFGICKKVVFGGTFWPLSSLSLSLFACFKRLFSVVLLLYYSVYLHRPYVCVSSTTHSSSSSSVCDGSFVLFIYRFVLKTRNSSFFQLRFISFFTVSEQQVTHLHVYYKGLNYNIPRTSTNRGVFVIVSTPFIYVS